MLFKICGLKNIDTIKCCEKNKVNYFGMIFYNKSPRYISFNEALKLVEYSKRIKIKPVGVFVNEETEIVNSYVKKLNLKTIQLHGDENNEYINKIKKNHKITIIKSISVRDVNDLKNLKNYDSNDYFLLDYKGNKDELPGGNAKTFDWLLLSKLNIKKPWFLSGGINISNINKIKKYANPDGIDLSSGVEESPGIKKIDMINSLFNKYYEK